MLYVIHTGSKKSKFTKIYKHNMMYVTIGIFCVMRDRVRMAHYRAMHVVHSAVLLS